jgi:hypothetical protein
MENAIANAMIGGIEWACDMELIIPARKRADLAWIWDDTGYEPTVPKARAILDSFRKFQHYAKEAVRVDRDEMSRGRYERAADRELQTLAQLPMPRLLSDALDELANSEI